MSTEVLIDLMQIILLTLTTVVVMLVAAFKRDHGLVSALTVAGLLASLLVFVFVQPVLPLQATPILMIDEYSLFFSALIIIASLAVALFAFPYFDKHYAVNEEFYLLLLMGTLGGVVLACSNHFVGFFLGMEILSISLYAMIAYPVHGATTAKFPLEAGVKYLILSGVASGTILFGVALVYSQLGTLAFPEIPAALAGSGGDVGLIMMIGVLMIVAGVAFKLSLVPFHMWTPDVYEGAPVPVTAFIATVSKAAMVAVTLRLLSDSGALGFGPVLVALALMAAVSMIVGNLLALLQNNVKRLLAYSSIAHLGYLMVAVIAGATITEAFAVESVGYYVAAYVIMTLAGFGVVSALSNNSREMDDMADLQGLFWRKPWLALVMTTVLLSLAGIPLTIGFIGKFYIFAAGVESDLWFLLTMVVIGSGIGLYYYLRLVYAMALAPADDSRTDSARAPLPAGPNVALIALTTAIIWLGVYPAPLINTLQGLAGGF